MRKKFSKGDKVQLLTDLSFCEIVENVFIKNTYICGHCFSCEKVCLRDNKVYDSDELTFYSEPIRKLSLKIKELEDNLIKKSNKSKK